MSDPGADAIAVACRRLLVLAELLEARAARGEAAVARNIVELLRTRRHPRGPAA